jgi:uncharacterized repeat protein (TIGR02543 family)
MRVDMKRFLRRSFALLLVPLLVVMALPTVVSADSARDYMAVTFFQNDSAEDSVNIPQFEDAPTPLTLFANLGFSNPGYVFNDWNTTPNGLSSGINFSDGEEYNFDGNLSLYAQWTGDVYTLNYSANGGTVSPTSVTYTVGGSPLTLLTPTLNGSTFSGWNTLSNGSGSTYAAGASYVPTSNVTLYAQWTVTPLENVSTVNFDSNGGSGSIAPVNIHNGTILTMPSASALTYPGFTFAGWNTAALGTGTEYSSGDLLDVISSLTLFAQWTKDPPITVSFAANGGEGSVDALSGATGVSVTLPGGTGLSYAGHTFASWNTAADGSGTVLNIGTPLLLVSSLTLYAQWDPLLVTKSPTVLIGAVGSFAKNSSRLTTNLKTQIHRLAVLTKSGHFAAEMLYGYTSDTGTATSQQAISSRRASAVAQYLRTQLVSMHVAGVKVTSSGEGAFKAQTGASSRRVEVFVKG